MLIQQYPDSMFYQLSIFLCELMKNYMVWEKITSKIYFHTDAIWFFTEWQSLWKFLQNWWMWKLDWGWNRKIAEKQKRIWNHSKWWRTTQSSESPVSIFFSQYLHYDPLMMPQKEGPRKHPYVLLRKVEYRISANSFRGNYSFLEVAVRQLFKWGNY